MTPTLGDARAKRLQALREAFQRTHQRGMAGLASRNPDALGDALRREGEIIREQKEPTDAEQAETRQKLSEWTRRDE